MSALARLLVRVSKRVLTHNPTNDELLQTADRVILWRNADYITDAQVEEIAAVMPEESEESSEPTPEPEPESESEPESVDEPEPAPETSTTPDYEAMTKHDLFEWAEAHGITVYESWTKAEIVAAIQAALSEGE